MELWFIENGRHYHLSDHISTEHSLQGLFYTLVPQAIDQRIKQWTYKGVEDSCDFGFFNSLLYGWSYIHAEEGAIKEGYTHHVGTTGGECLVPSLC